MNEHKAEYKWVGTRTIRPDGVDKVTGRANFGADHALPGMLNGRVLRSPHAHARVLAIDTSKAEALAGVKAVMTYQDLAANPDGQSTGGESAVDFYYLSRNVLARDKVLYDGHAVAAVAAISPAIAEAALALIAVDYEVLPHVIDVDAAMADDAPILIDGLITKGVDPKPEKASNVANQMGFETGDIAAGFAEADFIIERSYKTEPVHQGYIEPHAVVANHREDGQVTIWASSQGQFMIRNYVAKLLDLELSSIRVIPAEIGGGFGGKTTVYLEPLAVVLSRKSGRPVKMVMSRDEVFRGTGPTSGTSMDVKLGLKNDGTITAAEAQLRYQAGAFPGSPVQLGCMTIYTPYNITNAKVTGYDVVVNRPKAAAYRAPGAPMASFAMESALEEAAHKIGMDPLELRQKNVAKEGDRAIYGPKHGPIGQAECMAAAQASEHYKIKLGPNQGRGVANGFWFNIGGQSTAQVNVAEDGTVVVVSPNPDIGGSRASLAIMAAEVLGVDINKVTAIVGDTASIGYSDVTGGSRVTFSIGMAVVDASTRMVKNLRARAAKLWDIDVEAVEWSDGEARPAGDNAGKFEPLSLADIAAKAAKTGGPIAQSSALTASGAGPGFGTHICDVEIDPETGAVTILRYTAIQDVGQPIHPGYVEGQLQGGAVQGIGWALNEEYIYDDKGRLENSGFLDYRMPVASDLPMIDAVLIKVPNPRAPFGVRGVGEVPIIPPLAAVANAVAAASGVVMADLPISPPKLVAAMAAKA